MTLGDIPTITGFLRSCETLAIPETLYWGSAVEPANNPPPYTQIRTGNFSFFFVPAGRMTTSH